MDVNEISRIALKKLTSEYHEDLGGRSLEKDITSKHLIKKNFNANVVISNREEIVLCGEFFTKFFLKKKFPKLKYKSNFVDGNRIKKKSVIIEIFGDLKSILAVERTILNFIQHLSSISTYTNNFVKILKGSKTKLLDTRKTTIGLRKIEKYATHIGGAENHRMGLYDKILIKDNHIKLIGSISATLTLIEKKKIENFMIECDTFSQVKKCIKSNVGYILLDNMKPEEIKKCIKLKNGLKNKVLFEITGGINLKNFRKYCNLGADYISVSQITNCPKSVDIGLDII